MYKYAILHYIIIFHGSDCPFEIFESLIFYARSRIFFISFSLLSSSFPLSLSLSSSLLFVSLLVFHAYALARTLAFLTRRNNYYYESDPGQETTIAFSFLLFLPSPPSLVPRGPHAEFVGLVLFSPRVSSYLQPADGTLDRDTRWFTERPSPVV